MTEAELRALVRDAIARHVGGAPAGPGAQAPQPRIAAPSHQMFRLQESGGPCLVEPAVACNHCGFCKSYGH